MSYKQFLPLNESYLLSCITFRITRYFVYFLAFLELPRLLSHPPTLPPPLSASHPELETTTAMVVRHVPPLSNTSLSCVTRSRRCDTGLLWLKYRPVVWDEDENRNNLPGQMRVRMQTAVNVCVGAWQSAESLGNKRMKAPNILSTSHFAWSWVQTQRKQEWTRIPHLVVSVYTQSSFMKVLMFSKCWNCFRDMLMQTVWWCGGLWLLHWQLFSLFCPSLASSNGVWITRLGLKSAIPNQWAHRWASEHHPLGRGRGAAKWLYILLANISHS